MVRAIWLGLALTAATAAGRPPALPVPPIPPLHAPTESLAPMPNPDASAPVPAASLAPQVRMQDFRIHSFDGNMGYVPGSQFQSSEEKRPIQTPGVEVRLPLQ